jgi:hypothetical protein
LSSRDRDFKSRAVYWKQVILGGYGKNGRDPQGGRVIIDSKWNINNGKE